MTKKKDIKELGRLAQLVSGIAGHKESTAVGAAIIAYGLMGEMLSPETMSLIDKPLGLIAAGVLMLYRGKK